MQSKIRNLSLGLWVIFWVIFSSFHPFYVSVAEIKINETSKNIDISIKCFTNDLETVLRKENKEKIDILNQSIFEKNKILLQKYFKTNFNLKLNNKPCNMVIVGFEKEEDAIWTYFESEKVKFNKRNKIEISNTVLYNLTKEQLNINHLIKGENRQSLKVKYPDKTCSFNF